MCCHPGFSWTLQWILFRNGNHVGDFTLALRRFSLPAFPAVTEAPVPQWNSSGIWEEHPSSGGFLNTFRSVPGSPSLQEWCFDVSPSKEGSRSLPDPLPGKSSCKHGIRFCWAFFSLNLDDSSAFPVPFLPLDSPAAFSWHFQSPGGEIYLLKSPVWPLLSTAQTSILWVFFHFTLLFLFLLFYSLFQNKRDNNK